jgi:hypothetical protein
MSESDLLFFLRGIYGVDRFGFVVFTSQTNLKICV